MLRFVSLATLLLVLSVCDAALAGRRFGQRGGPEGNYVRRILYPRSVDEEPCKTDDGQLGFCVDVRTCYAAKRAVITGNQPARCGWIDGHVPMVCCHPDQFEQPKMV